MNLNKIQCTNLTDAITFYMLDIILDYVQFTKCTKLKMYLHFLSMQFYCLVLKTNYSLVEIFVKAVVALPRLSMRLECCYPYTVDAEDDFNTAQCQKSYLVMNLNNSSYGQKCIVL